MPDLRASRPISDEIDGLDESVEGVPEPNTASEFTADYALPTVVPKHVRPLAVVALILAFTVPVVAIPLGHRVLRRLQHEGAAGGGSRRPRS
ncbi:hypothetical protein [Leifsonia xyli]|uniref:hypothetical protein n=1 Tax=Leifsonia xyli TaxID=1575 RepID=UPI003D667158